MTEAQDQEKRARAAGLIFKFVAIAVGVPLLVLCGLVAAVGVVAAR